MNNLREAEFFLTIFFNEKFGRNRIFVCFFNENLVDAAEMNEIMNFIWTLFTHIYREFKRFKNRRKQ